MVHLDMVILGLEEVVMVIMVITGYLDMEMEEAAEDMGNDAQIHFQIINKKTDKYFSPKVLIMRALNIF